jgi:DNA-binding transcriptional ArsR family regulator
MRAKEEYRDRDDAEVALLDALADRAEEGLTVFELRSHVDVEIDTIEDALARLKADGLIEVHNDNQRTVIVPDEAVITTGEPPEEDSLLDDIRDRFPF